jgi:hypothetical protein
MEPKDVSALLNIKIQSAIHLIFIKEMLEKDQKIYFITHSTSKSEIALYGLLTICGIVIATVLPVIGTFQALIGLAMITRQEEIWFDLDKNLYKNTFRVLGVCFGKWKNIPPQKFLLLKKLTQSANLSSAIWGDFTHRVYYYKLFLKIKQPKLSFELMAHMDEDVVVTEAKEIAELFKTELKMDI